MTRLVEFQKLEGGRVAINPDLVTTIEVYRDDATCIYVRDSNGGIDVRGSFDEVIAALTAEPEPKAKRQSLPQVADLVGLDPDFTGGLSSEDYVRKMRDAENG